MIRLLAPALLLSTALLSTACVAAAQSPPPPPVCGSREVLDFVAEHLHRAGQSTTIEASAVGEVPGPSRGIVHCAVRVHTLIYDTVRLGAAPADRVSVYRFSLDLRRNAIFLADEP